VTAARSPPLGGPLTRPPIALISPRPGNTRLAPEEGVAGAWSVSSQVLAAERRCGDGDGEVVSSKVAASEGVTLYVSRPMPFAPQARQQRRHARPQRCCDLAGKIRTWATCGS